jgi:hypothetical protein
LRTHTDDPAVPVFRQYMSIFEEENRFQSRQYLYNAAMWVGYYSCVEKEKKER